MVPSPSSPAVIDPPAAEPQPAAPARRLRPDQARTVAIAERDFGVGLRAAGYRARRLAQLYRQLAGDEDKQRVDELAALGRQLRTLADDFHPIHTQR